LAGHEGWIREGGEVSFGFASGVDGKPGFGPLSAPPSEAPQETSPPSRLHCRGLLRLKTDKRSQRRSSRTVTSVAGPREVARELVNEPAALDIRDGRSR